MRTNAYGMSFGKKSDYETTLNSLQSISVTKTESKRVQSLVEQSLFYLELYEQTLIIRFDLATKDVVCDPERQQHMEARVNGVLNGILNFDGTPRT